MALYFTPGLKGWHGDDINAMVRDATKPTMGGGSDFPECPVLDEIAVRRIEIVPLHTKGGLWRPKSESATRVVNAETLTTVVDLAWSGGAARVSKKYFSMKCVCVSIALLWRLSNHCVAQSDASGVRLEG
jgi:hypothetical protein